MTEVDNKGVTISERTEENKGALIDEQKNE